MLLSTQTEFASTETHLKQTPLLARGLLLARHLNRHNGNCNVSWIEMPQNVLLQIIFNTCIEELCLLCTDFCSRVPLFWHLTLAANVEDTSDRRLRWTTHPKRKHRRIGTYWYLICIILLHQGWNPVKLPQQRRVDASTIVAHCSSHDKKSGCFLSLRYFRNIIMM